MLNERSKFRFLLLAGGLFCGSRLQAAVHKFPASYAADVAQADADRLQAEQDRKALVIPAPTDFKPLKAVPFARLRLVFDKTSYRVGEKIKYRFELQNVGNEALQFDELRSFVKSGRLPGDRIFFYVTNPAGKESVLSSPPKSHSDVTGEMDIPSSVPESDKRDWVAQRIRTMNAQIQLSVKLFPGEILRTPGEAGEQNFRTLVVLNKFDRPGRYSIRAVLNPHGVIPDEAAKAEFEVVP